MDNEWNKTAFTEAQINEAANAPIGDDFVNGDNSDIPPTDYK